jgi:hypothetical protein
MAITRLGGANAISGTIPQGNIANASLGAVTALPAAIPTGKILQVSSFVQASGGQTVSSSSYVDLTNITLNITPSAASSKILLTANLASELNINNGNRGYGMKFLRDSTAVYGSGNTYEVYIQQTGTNTGQHHLTHQFNYIDSPNTTSQITYKVQVATEGGNAVPFNAPLKSNIFAMEIAG